MGFSTVCNYKVNYFNFELGNGSMNIDFSKDFQATELISDETKNLENTSWNQMSIEFQIQLHKYFGPIA